MREATERIVGVSGMAGENPVEDVLAASEEILRALTEITSVGVCIFQDDRLRYVNQAMEALTGYTQDDLLSMDIMSLVHPDSAAEVASTYETWITQNTLDGRYELNGFNKQGLVRWVEITGKTIQYHDKPAVLLTIIDITGRKQAEENLMLAQAAIDRCGDSAVWFGENGKITYVNDAACLSTGYSRAELLSMTNSNLYPNFSTEDFEELRRTVKQQGSTIFETIHRAKDGRAIPVEVSLNYVRHGNGEYCISFNREITDRKRAEEALLQANLVVENSPVVLFRWKATEDWPVTFVSRNVTRFGYKQEEFLSGAISYVSIIHPEDRERVAAEVRAYSFGNLDHFQQEYRIITKAGEARWVDDRTMIERDHDSQITHYQGIILDITERKEAEGSLRESEERLKLCVKAARLGIYDYDPESDRHVWSPEAYYIYGLLESQPLTLDYIRGLVIPEDLRDDLVDSELNPETTHGGYVLMYRIRRVSDGAIRWIHNTTRIFFSGEGSDRKAVRLIGVIQDITELKQAEESLRESEAKFRALADTSSAMVWLYQGDRLVYVNNATERMMGYTRDELLRMKFWETAHPEFRELVKARGLARQRGEKVPSRYEVKHLTKTGEAVWLEVTTGNIEYQGKPAIIATFFDITDRKRSEAALVASESKFKTLFEGACITIVMIDAETELIISCNSYGERLFGRPERDLIGLEFIRLHPLEDAELHRRAFRRNVENSIGLNFESEVLHNDGRRIPVIINARPHMIDGRKLMMAFFLDITDRKRAENALKRSQYILAKSQEIAHVGNWAWNVQTGLITGSEEVFRLFGSEVNHNTDICAFLSRVHPDDRRSIGELAEKVIQTGVTANIDYRIAMRDGSARHMNIIVDKTLLDGTGKVRMVYGIQQDITDRKQAERALEESKAQADLYLDLMGHDINNMNQIGIGFLELALDKPGLTEAERHLLAKSLDAFISSSRLIDNLRKLQKVRSGEMRYHDIDISQVLSTVRADYSSLPDKNVHIDYSPLNGSVVTANDLIYDLFSNLVGNAIKHTPHDPVIDIRLEKLQEVGKWWYRVSVEDNGPGIPDVLKEKIFNRHLRGGTTANGSGIGLYLVKTLVCDYCGYVWVEDRIRGDPSRGSRFVVLLPAIEKLTG
ncbi:MAG TPA: PAS domain S-box protein [Methanocella sp.]|nr:PAS domain S-box protein [Methanocella sp.]